MATLRIWKSLLERARDRASLTEEELAIVEAMLDGKTGEINVNIDKLPTPVVRALLDEGKLKPGERAQVVLRILGMKSDRLETDELYITKVGGPIEFGSILLASTVSKPNAEMLWNGRWYPIKARAEFHEEDKRARTAEVQVQLGVGNEVVRYSSPINPSWFQNPDGSHRECTVLEIFGRFGFRALQTDAASYNLRLVSAERLSAESGKQMLLKGAVLETRRVWMGTGLSELTMGTEDAPRRVVIESTLNDSDEGHGYYPGDSRGAFDEKVSRMPLVRVFSLENKRYVYADVDDLLDYEYDAEAINRLILPEEMKGVLASVFRASKDELFGDHVRNKHGGIVILACGHPGVGKTLTAEVYAELTRRPLYVLEFGELGTTVQEIESKLSTVFARVVRWRAVLQFDECEVFLAKRGEDLNRSAIVGIFLRMLDYYEGLLFLTSNRPEVMDHAVHSRVMLRLDYPDLTPTTRAEVWRTMLRAADMTLSDDGLHQVAAEPLNGRQIRNRVRLARIMYGTAEVSTTQMQLLARYSSHAQDVQ